MKRIVACSIVCIVLAGGVFWAIYKAKGAAPARVEIPSSSQQTLADAEAGLTQAQQVLEKQQIYAQGVVNAIAVPLLGKDWYKTHKLVKEGGYAFVELTEEEKKKQQPQQ